MGQARKQAESGRPAVNRRPQDKQNDDFAKPVEGSPGCARFVPGDAALGVIVDQPHRLHERKNGCEADERPSTFLEVF